MQLVNQIDENTADEMLAFYKNHFNHVAVVYCNKCETPIALLLGSSKSGDTMGLKFNDAGLAVVPVGNNLLSSRVRLDRTPSGEPMLGFECNVQLPNPDYPKAKAEFIKQKELAQELHQKQVKHAEAIGEEPPVFNDPYFDTPETLPCGNNTILAEPEIGLVPISGTPIDYSNPFEKHKIGQQIAAHTTYKPDFDHHGHIKRYETFRTEIQ